MLDVTHKLEKTNFPIIHRNKLSTLQVNLGYLCNQTCTHCHVDAGPRRTEIMTKDNIDAVIEFIKNNKIDTLDLTGGAPEMNPHFIYLIEQVSELDVQVIDRCNLTILSELGYENIAATLAKYKVHVVASLPCYEEENVDEQRGKNVFNGSIKGLKMLNDLGYGYKEGLQLDLVYNPTGTNLPPSQFELEPLYKKELKERYDIVFNHLLTITNMPIKRFGSMLLSKGIFDEYMDSLKAAYSVQNLDSVMCKTLLSVDWQGYLFDCDFNQMLDMGVKDNKAIHLSDLDVEWLHQQAIKIGDHCYGCTAGNGSSCTGALTPSP